jgi:hypothetical protein
MPTLPKSLFWLRTDVAGADHALIDDAHGLYARGVAVAAAPVPYTCRYELVTDEGWTTARLDVTAEGAGWLRTARLERAAGRWRVTTAEQGDLDRALVAAGRARAALPGTEEPDRLADAADVDLGGAPLFNTLPVRRLRLLDAPPGTERDIEVARVLVPSLQVVVAEQNYAVVDGGVRYLSRSFSAELSLDAHGYVIRYPGLAERAP